MATLNAGSMDCIRPLLVDRAHLVCFGHRRQEHLVPKRLGVHFLQPQHVFAVDAPVLWILIDGGLLVLPQVDDGRAKRVALVELDVDAVPRALEQLGAGEVLREGESGVRMS